MRITRRQPDGAFQELLRRRRLRQLIQAQIVEGRQRRHRVRQQHFPRLQHGLEIIGVDGHLEAFDHIDQLGDRRTQHPLIVQVFDQRCNRNTNKIKDILRTDASH